MLFQGEVKPHSCNQNSTLSNTAEIVENERIIYPTPLGQIILYVTVYE